MANHQFTEMEKLVLVGFATWVDWHDDFSWVFFRRLWVQNCEGPGDVYIYIHMRTIAWKNTSKILRVLLYTLPLLCNMMYIYIYMIVIHIHITDDYHHCYSCYSRTTRFHWCALPAETTGIDGKTLPQHREEKVKDFRTRTDLQVRGWSKMTKGRRLQF